MRLVLLGATGKVGRCVARKALQLGPQVSVTIFVRSKTKLEALLGAEALKTAKIVEGSIEDASALAAVMKGQEACICTAGSIASGRAVFPQTFISVVRAAAEGLVGPKRLWMMAGCTLLSLPKSDYLINDLPIFSLLPYSVHTRNFAALKELGGDLDWSIMCPGQLHPQNDADLKIKSKAVAEIAPVHVPSVLVNWRLLWLFAVLFVGPQMSKFGGTLEATAEFMIQNLDAHGIYEKKRVALISA